MTIQSPPSLELVSNLIVSCASQGRTNQQVVLIEQGDESSSLSSSMVQPSQITHSIWGNLTGTQCDDWFQYQITSIATSTQTLASLQHALNATSMMMRRMANHSNSNLMRPPGFSLAVWFSVSSSSRYVSNPLDSSIEYPIASFASPYKKDVWTGCPGWSDMELAYVLEPLEATPSNNSINDNRSPNASVLLRYVDSDDARTCRSVRIPASALLSTGVSSFSSSHHHHVVVSWTSNSLHIFWQGQQVVSTLVSSPFDTTLSTWDPTDRLQLLRKSSTIVEAQYDDLDDQDNTNVANDSILGVHQIQCYANGLDLEIASQLYQTGFQHKKWNASSNNKTALVQFIPNVVPNVMVVPQDSMEPTSFNLSGTLVWNRDLSIVSQPADSDTSSLSLSVQVTRFPKYGAISATAGDNHRPRREWEWEIPLPLINGTNASLTVNFSLLDHDFYNVPPPFNNSLRLSHPADSLDATLSIVWRDELLATEYVSIPVQIQQVNHAPKLTAPPRVEATQATVYLTNVTLHDVDATTPVRVDVSASHSQLTLNADCITQADFVTCRQRSDSPWQCVGDGMDDRTLIFVAPTGTVNHILDRLQVDLIQSDNVTIRIYDGEGGDCLSAREHALYGSALTIHRGCYVAEASIYIAVDPNVVHTPLGNTNVSRIAKLLFWGLALAVGLGIVVCLRRCLPRCLAKGRWRRGAIDADDGNALPRNASDLGTIFTQASVGKASAWKDVSSSSECASDSDDCDDDCASC